MDRNDVTQLSHEVIYQRYLMHTRQFEDMFQILSVSEYILLQTICELGRDVDGCVGRTYLRDLAQKMQLTMRNTSQKVSLLCERGLVVWTHDDNGSEGTYVTVTQTGEKLLQQQNRVCKEYYEAVIAQFGEQNMVDLIEQMRQLERVMNRVRKEMEVKV